MPTGPSGASEVSVMSPAPVAETGQDPVAPGAAAGNPDPWASPSPFRNLLTPLCSPLGSVSRYSWARTSNRPVDKRNPNQFSSFSQCFYTCSFPYCCRQEKLRRSCSINTL